MKCVRELERCLNVLSVTMLWCTMLPPPPPAPFARKKPVSEQRELWFPQLLEPWNFAVPFSGRQ